MSGREMIRIGIEREIEIYLSSENPREAIKKGRKLLDLYESVLEEIKEAEEEK